MKQTNQQARKIILKESLSLGDAFFSTNSGSSTKQQYMHNPESIEEEKRILGKPTSVEDALTQNTNKQQ